MSDVIKDDYLKLIYRADLHRKFLLKHRAFFIWKNSVNVSKTYNIRSLLASKFYKKKILQKYFYILCVNCKFFKCQQIINAYLRSNIVILYRIMYVQQLLLWIIDIRNQLFTHHDKVIRAKMYFHQKYTKHTQPVFDEWKKYTDYSLRKKEKTLTAITFRNTTLKRQTFNLLRKHYTKMKRSTILFRTIQQYYHTTLKSWVLRSWKQYTTKSIHKRNQITFADNHYAIKIKTRLFLIWKTHTKRILYLHNTSSKLKSKHNRKLLKKYLYNWSLYSQQRKFNNEKKELSTIYYHIKLTRRVFDLLLHHYKLQKIKDSVNTYTVEKYLKKRMECTPRTYFNKWKLFVHHQNDKRLLQFRVDQHYDRSITKKYFTNWLDYLNKKKYYKSRLKSAEDFNNQKITTVSFKTWVEYTRHHKHIKNVITEHKKKFNSFLVTFSIKRIVNKGEEIQRSRYKNILDEHKSDFYTKLYYFKKWKYSVWNSKDEPLQRFEPLEFMDVWALKPKIPSYFDRKNILLL